MRNTFVYNKVGPEYNRISSSELPLVSVLDSHRSTKKGVEKKYVIFALIKTAIALIFVLLFTVVKGQQIGFTPNIGKGCSPLVVQFNEINTQNTVERIWNFGNGNTSSHRNPTAMYTSPGTYTVALYTRDSSGNRDTFIYEQCVTVFKNPIANFTSSLFNGCVGDTMKVQPQIILGDAPINRYLWDWGNGLTSNLPTPVVQYQQGGSYAVTLWIVDTNQCQSAQRKNNHFTIRANPAIQITANKYLECGTPVNIQFNVNVTGDTITHYRWSFPGNLQSTIKNPSFTFTSQGKHDVQLWVKDKHGCSSTSHQKDFIHILQVNAGLSVENQVNCLQSQVRFNNLTHPDISQMRYQWNFGDGTSSTQKNPSKSYSNAGNYHIRLISHIPNTQCIDTAFSTTPVQIVTPRNIVPIISDTQFCDLPKSVSFRPSASVRNAFWKFTNSPYDTSSKINSTYNFLQPGNYNIEYSFTDMNGCLVKGVKNGGVKVQSSTAVIKGKMGGCIPANEKYTAHLNGNITPTAYEWFLNDVFISSQPDVTLSFNTPGLRSLRVRIHSGLGCTSEATVKLGFGDKTNPDFKIEERIVCHEIMTGFIMIPNPDKPQVTHNFWIFEGKNQSSSQFQFSEYKDQEVSLVTFNFGCADTVTKIFTIGGENPLIKGPVANIWTNLDTCNRILTIRSNVIDYTNFRWSVNQPMDTTVKEITIKLADTSERFSIQLFAENNLNQCPDVLKTREIITPPKLTTSFVSEGNYCAPSLIQFKNTSNYIATDIFRWYVNGSEVKPMEEGSDEVVSSTVNMNYSSGTTGSFSPIFRFGNSGLFEIKMTSRRDGCLDSITEKVNIIGPEVNISASTTDICLPARVHLTDHWYTNGKKAMWIIDKKDTIHSTSAFMEHWIHNSNKNGTLPIRYVEWNKEGCLTWKDLSIAIPGPFVQIQSTELNYCDRTEFEFKPIVSYQKNDIISRFDWSIEGNIFSHDSIFKHQFSDEGKYDIELALIFESGCTAITEATVTFIEENLKAGMSSDTVGAFCPPLLVNFSNASIERKKFPIVHYSWDFGDGTYSNLKNPTKIFITPGKFNISLTVIDALGCSDTHTIDEMIFVNGPNGVFFIDTLTGCSPHAVQLHVDITDPLTKVFWDLGDGQFSNEHQLKHYYTRAGKYSPSVLLTDPYGCEFVLPQKEQIEVFPTPQAHFIPESFCIRNETKMVNFSSISSGESLQFHWYINDEYISDKVTLSYLFDSADDYHAKLIAHSSKGCINTFEDDIQIRDFRPQVDIHDSVLCLGSMAQISHHTKERNRITEVVWELSDGQKSYEWDPRLYPKQKGLYSMSLYLKDNIGCDTIFKVSSSILVGDTLSNISPDILSVSVLDDHSVCIKSKSSAEIDFEHYQLYRQDELGKVSLISQHFNRFDTLYTDVGVNTLSNIFCYLLIEENICKSKQDLEDIQPHCTVELSAEGDTNKCILNWNPYVGWNEVESYQIYRSTSEKDSFHFLTYVDGKLHTYTDEHIVCSGIHQYRILAIETNGKETSWSDTCQAKPIYVNEVPRPTIQLSSIWNDNGIEIYWNNDIEFRNPIVDFELERSHKDSTHYKQIQKISASSDYHFVDVQQTHVHSSNYYYRLRSKDACGDYSQYSVFTRPILLHAYLNNNYKPTLTWSPYQYWIEGVDYYEVQQLMPHGEFEKVGQTTTGYDTIFVHEDVQLNCLDVYQYRVVAIKKSSNYMHDRSISNTASVEVESKIFTPNAFSPNGDGTNDIFETKGIYIKSFHMKILNRWGEKIYESDDCMSQWDGTYNGIPVPTGVFAVMIKAVGVDNKQYNIKTDLTLIR